VVVFIWSWVAALLIWCLLIWEARTSFAAVFRGLIRKTKVQHTPGLEMDSDDGKESVGEEPGRKADTNEKVMEVA
jgi:hypothetical protein